MTIAYITELEQSVADSLINTFKHLLQIQQQKEQEKNGNEKTFPNLQSNELKFVHRAKLHNLAISHAHDILHHKVSTMHQGIKERAKHFKDYTEICFLSPPIPKENKTMYDRGKELFNVIMEKYGKRVVKAYKYGCHSFGVGLVPLKSSNTLKDNTIIVAIIFASSISAQQPIRQENQPSQENQQESQRISDQDNPNYDDNESSQIQVNPDSIRNLFRKVKDSKDPIYNLTSLYTYINSYRVAVNLNKLKPVDKIPKINKIEIHHEKKIYEAKTAGILFLNLIQNDNFLRIINHRYHEISIHGKKQPGNFQIIILFNRNVIKKDEKNNEPENRPMFSEFSFFVKTDDDEEFYGSETNLLRNSKKQPSKSILYESPILPDSNDVIPIDLSSSFENFSSNSFAKLTGARAQSPIVSMELINQKSTCVENKKDDTESYYEEEEEEEEAGNEKGQSPIKANNTIKEEKIIKATLPTVDQFEHENISDSSKEIPTNLYNENQSEKEFGQKEIEEMENDLGGQNEEIPFSKGQPFIGSPTNKSKWNDISGHLTNYDDSEDVKLSPRSLRASHKTILPPSPRDKKRNIPELDDEFYDDETLKTKGNETITEPQATQEQHEVQQEVIPTLEEEESQETEELAPSVETIAEAILEGAGGQNEEIPFSKGQPFIGSPTNKSKWNDISGHLTNYDDSEDVKLSPRSLRASHKTILPPSPRDKKRNIPELDDEFYDDETLKTKGNETITEPQATQEQQEAQQIQEEINQAAEVIAEAILEGAGGQNEEIPFSKGQPFIGSPTNKSKWNDISGHLTNYDDSEDVKLSPRSLRASHKTILPPSPRDKKRNIPELDDEFYDDETLKTKGNETITEPQATQEQHEVQQEVIPTLEEEESQETEELAPSVETIAEAILEGAGGQNEEIPFSKGQPFIGSPTNKSKWNDISGHLTNYDDSEDVKLSPRSLRASHKTILPPSPRDKKRNIPELDDEFYDDETLKTKGNETITEPQATLVTQEAQQIQEELAPSVETIAEAILEGAGGQNEEIPFSKGQPFIGSPTNKSKWNDISGHLTNYDDSEDVKLSPRSLRASHKTILPPSPRDKKRNIPELDDEFYDDETLKTKGNETITEPQATQEQHEVQQEVIPTLEEEESQETEELAPSVETIAEAILEGAGGQNEEIPFSKGQPFIGSPTNKSKWNDISGHLTNYDDSEDVKLSPRSLRASHKTILPPSPRDKKRNIPELDDEFYDDETLKTKGNETITEPQATQEQHEVQQEVIPTLEEEESQETEELAPSVETIAEAILEGAGGQNEEIPFSKGQPFIGSPTNKSKWNDISGHLTNYDDSEDVKLSPRSLRASHKTILPPSPRDKKRNIPELDDEFYDDETLKTKGNETITEPQATQEQHEVQQEVIPTLEEEESQETEELAPSVETIAEAILEGAGGQNEEIPFSKGQPFIGSPTNKSKWNDISGHLTNYDDSEDVKLSPRSLRASHKTILPPSPRDKKRNIPELDDEFYDDETLKTKGNETITEPQATQEQHEVQQEVIPTLEEEESQETEELAPSVETIAEAILEGAGGQNEEIPFSKGQPFIGSPTNKSKWNDISGHLTNYDDSEDVKLSPRSLRASHKTILPPSPRDKKRNIPELDDEFYDDETLKTKGNETITEPQATQEQHEVQQEVIPTLEEEESQETEELAPSVETIAEAILEGAGGQNEEIPFSKGQPFIGSPTNKSKWNDISGHLTNYDDSEDVKLSPRSLRASHKTILPPSPRDKKRNIPELDDEFYDDETLKTKGNETITEPQATQEQQEAQQIQEEINQAAEVIAEAILEGAGGQNEEIPFSKGQPFIGSPTNKSKWNDISGHLTNYDDSEDVKLSPRSLRASHKTILPPSPRDKKRNIPELDDEFYDDETLKTKGNETITEPQATQEQHEVQQEVIPTLEEEESQETEELAPSVETIAEAILEGAGGQNEEIPFSKGQPFIGSPTNKSKWNDISGHLTNYDDSEDVKLSPRSLRASHKTILPPSPRDKKRNIPELDDEFYDDETLKTKGNETITEPQATQEQHEVQQEVIPTLEEEESQETEELAPSVETIAEAILEGAGGQNEEIPFSKGQPFIGSPTNKSKWNDISGHLTNYDDSEDVKLSPRSLRASHKTILPPSPRDKKRNIPELDDEFYDDETLKTKGNETITEPQATQEQHEVQQEVIPTLEEEESQETEELAPSVETIAEAILEGAGGQNEEIPFSKGQPFIGSPTNKSKWNDISGHLTNYDDSEDVKLSPRSLRASHKTILPPSPRDKKRNIPELDDEFYDDETLKTKGNETITEPQATQEQQEAQQIQEEINQAAEVIAEAILEGAGGQNEEIPFSKGQPFIGSPTNKSKWNDISGHLTNYDDSEDVKLSPRSLRASHKTILPPSPRDKKRNIPELDDEFYDDETLKTKGNETITEPQATQEQHEVQQEVIPTLEEEESQETEELAPSVETIAEAILEGAGGQNEEIPFSKGQPFIGSPTNKSKWNDISGHLTNYDDSEDVKLSPRSLRASHKTILPPSPRDKKRNIPELDDEFYDDETLKTKGNETITEPQATQEQHEVQQEVIPTLEEEESQETEELAPSVETIAEAILEGAGGQNEEIPFSKGQPFIGSPTNKSKWNDISGHLTNYDDSEDVKLSPRSLRASHKTILPPSPRDKKRNIPELDDEFYDDETLKTKGNETITEPQATQEQQEAQQIQEEINQAAEVIAEAILEGAGGQNEEIPFSKGQPFIGSPTNKSKWNDISGHLTNYDDSEDVKLSPRSLRASHKTILPPSPRDKKRNIPELDDEFYDDETLKTKGNETITEPQATQEQHEVQQEVIPTLEEEESQETEELAPSVETIAEAILEGAGGQNEEIPFSKGQPFIGSPTNKSKWNDISGHLTNYDDSEDVKLSPRSLRASHKTILPPSPRDKKRNIPELDDEFYDDETLKTKGNETITEPQATQEQHEVQQEVIPTLEEEESQETEELAPSVETIAEAILEGAGGQNEEIPFSKGQPFIGSPTNKSKWNDISGHLTNYDDSEDVKLSPRSLRASHKTILPPSPRDKKRNIPELDDEFYDDETLKTKGNETITEPQATSVTQEQQQTQEAQILPKQQELSEGSIPLLFIPSQEISERTIPLLEEEESQETEELAPSVETIAEAILEGAGGQNEEIPFSKGQPFIGSPTNKSKWNDISGHLTNYDDSEDVKLSPRSLRASHKTILPPSPRDKKRNIPELDDEFYDDETLKTKGNETITEPQATSVTQEQQQTQEAQILPKQQELSEGSIPLLFIPSQEISERTIPLLEEEESQETEELAPSVETIAEAILEGAGGQNEEIPFSKGQPFIGSPTNKSKWNDISGHLTNYDDSEDVKLSPRSLRASHKTILPPSPRDKKRNIPELDDEFYDDETLKTKGNETITEPQETSVTQEQQEQQNTHEEVFPNLDEPTQGISQRSISLLDEKTIQPQEQTTPHLEEEESPEHYSNGEQNNTEIQKQAEPNTLLENDLSNHEENLTIDEPKEVSIQIPKVLGQDESEMTLEIDINELLCSYDNIKEISFEFYDQNSNQNQQIEPEKDSRERLVDIDFSQLNQGNDMIHEIDAEINGEDTIIKSKSASNKNEIDVLEMDDNEPK